MNQENNLGLPRCQHCSVANPNLRMAWSVETHGHSGANPRQWVIYQCATCGGLITTASRKGQGTGVVEIYPSATTVSEDLPPKAQQFLSQAIDSLHAPAGAVMLAASAVDAMLKAKNYVDGSFYSRIDAAAEAHLITKEMAEWAHEVRLDANEQRHADEEVELPSDEDAERTIGFARALGEFLFVLPARVSRGRANTGAEDAI